LQEDTLESEEEELNAAQRRDKKAKQKAGSGSSATAATAAGSSSTATATATAGSSATAATAAGSSSTATATAAAGSSATAATAKNTATIPDIWHTWLQQDLDKYGKPGDVPYFRRVLSGAEIETYKDLRDKLDKPSVGFQVFEEAASRQNFCFLAKKAESSARVGMVKERLADSAFYAHQEGDTTGSEKIQSILDIIEGYGPELTDSQMISLLMEEIHIEYLQDVVRIYDQLRYSEVTWLIQRDKVLGKSLCKHEDFFHKLKRVMSSVRTQKPTSKAGKVLLDKAKLLAIAKKNPHEHKLIIAALTGVGSDAMDPFAQSRMFASKTFYDDVHKEDPDLALVLRTVGEYYDAHNKTSLSGRERARRLSAMHDLFYAVLGSHWYCHKRPPSMIAGMPLRLWFALAANVDSTRVLVNLKLDPEAHEAAGSEDSKERRLQPFTALQRPFKRPRLLGKEKETTQEKEKQTTLRDVPLKANGYYDERAFKLIRRLQNSLIKYRYVGTYDLEGGFSSLVMMVGFKPAIRIALGVLKKAQTLSLIRAMPYSGFFFPRSRRARYYYFVHRRNKGGGRSLVDEWFGSMGLVKESKRNQERERALRKDIVIHARAYAKRSSTVKKGTKDGVQ